MLDSLEIRLLGEFAMLKGGREVQAPTYKKARILVAHLALNPGHEFRRDDLATHLWPDVAREKARFNLRQLLAVIRRTSPELTAHIVANDRISIRFEPGAALVDALHFERLASLDTEAALEFYRGPLLTSIDDPWLRAPRAKLEEAYLTLLESLADASDARSAVKWLRRAAETDAIASASARQIAHGARGERRPERCNNRFSTLRRPAAP